jgi:protein-tyrosine phosphatase
MPAPTTRVLFVCLGNICRSPAAEGIFLQLLEQRGLKAQFEVDSAGTGSWHVGRRADPRMRAAAERRGIDLPSRARQLVQGDLRHYDLILTMDGDNLAEVRDLARGTGATATIKGITSYCRRSAPADVPDPYYGGAQGFEQVLDLLEDACMGLLEQLHPSDESG